MFQKLRSLSVLVAASAALPTGAQQQSVACAASGHAEVCPADTSNGVLLLREQSQHRCELGKTWRYDRKGIHVSDGCDAVFLVNPKIPGPGRAGVTGPYKTYGTGENAGHTNGSLRPRDYDPTVADGEGSAKTNESKAQPK